MEYVLPENFSSLEDKFEIYVSLQEKGTSHFKLGPKDWKAESTAGGAFLPPLPIDGDYLNKLCEMNTISCNYFVYRSTLMSNFFQSLKLNSQSVMSDGNK